MGRRAAPLGSDELWRALFANSQRRIMVVNREGQILDHNRLDLGPIDELAGRSVYDVFYQTQPDAMRCVLERVLRTGVPESLDTTEVRPSGIAWYDNRVLPVNRGDRAVGAIITSLDVTEPKLAEEQLRKAHEEYRQLFESAVIGIGRTTPEGRIIAANPALARLLGYPSPEALMASVTDVAAQHWTRPEHRLEYVRLLREHGRVSGFETELRDADGLSVWLSVTARAVRDASGEVGYIESFVEDVTARKMAQDLLRTSEHAHRLLFEANPVPMWVFDAASLAFLAVNEAAVRHYGYTREEFLRLTAKDVRPPEDVPAFLEWARPAGPGPLAGRGRHVKKDGTVIAVEVTAHDIVFAQRPAWLAVITDVSERARAEEMRSGLLERLFQAQEEERRRIARELHDEIGQALTSLLVGLRTLEGTAANREASALAAQLRSITGDAMEDVAHLARGLHPSALDDLGLIPAVKRHVEDHARLHDITANLDTSALGTERLPADVEVGLYRILQEMLTNITRHAGARRVDVAFRRSGSEVELRVRDDGVGMPSEADLQAQGHLGLVSIHERAVLLRGTVAIVSEPGEGTSLTVRIPLERAP